MSSSYFVTYGTDRLTFGGSGSVAWEYSTPTRYYNVTFGEGNMFSAGLTADKVVTAINGYWWDTGIAP